jgi:hypothetical protein
VNPHNPTGTVNEGEEFKRFLHKNSQNVIVIVDEAYLEYTADFMSRSAVSLLRDGANVVVFRTFDKIRALAGLSIGYVLAPRALADSLRKQGAGDAESLGRLNIVAASAALGDMAQMVRTRMTVALPIASIHQCSTSPLVVQHMHTGRKCSDGMVNVSPAWSHPAVQLGLMHSPQNLRASASPNWPEGSRFPHLLSSSESSDSRRVESSLVITHTSSHQQLAAR